MKRAWKGVLVLSDIAGWIFLLLSASFLIRYITETDNPLRHELGIGMAMGFLYGVWPALFSLAVSLYIRKHLQQWLFAASVALLPAFGVVMGVYNAIET